MKALFRYIIVFLLELEAKLVIRKYKPKIIGITGSVGKTSTKDALYSVLKTKLSVRKNEKSFNTEFGVPLTVLGRPNAWSDPAGWLANLWAGVLLIITKQNYPEWLILEIGADHPGDIEKLTRWLSLDVGIVTGMGEVPVHVEFFPDIDAVVREKSFVPKAVKKEGFVLLNADAHRVLEMKSVAHSRVLTYGFSSGTDFHGANLAIQYSDSGKPAGITFNLEHEGESVQVVLEKTVGAGQAFSAIAALACGELLGLAMSEMAEALRAHSATPGRLHLISGASDTTIIDDTYNSSPVAAKLALETLASVQTSGRKIAVLGDMMELGSHTKAEHEKIGAYAKGRADMLITLGMRAKFMAEGARNVKMRKEKIKSFDTREEVIEFLKKTIASGDAVLVKGSQSVRMEKIVEAIMNEPDRKKELLVRQDDEWQRR